MARKEAQSGKRHKPADPKGGGWNLVVNALRLFVQVLDYLDD